MKRPIADRKSEIEFFRRMLAGKVSAKILLIEAASGWGKTDLLNNFVFECGEDTCLVRIDLKGVEKGIADVFRIFRHTLGVSTFPHFESAVASEVNTPTVNIADNKSFFGQTLIEVALNVDEQSRKIRLMLLEEAFFRDLRDARSRIVVLFDTFEKAPPDLAQWISGSFLRAVASTPQMIVVIGGQRVPPRSIEEWEDQCERRALLEIDDIDEWHAFVQEAKLPLDRSAVQAIVLAFRGNPRDIRLGLQTIAQRWK